MDELAIGDVARRVGMRPSALRFYEEVGLLTPSRRVNGRRRYDEGAVQMLRIVQLAQQAGFSMAEIRTLLHGFAPETPPAARWRPLAERKVRELDTLIEQAQRMKAILASGLNCGCLRLEDCAKALDAAACLLNGEQTASSKT
jgi:MerR family redox-sensitive transcriptional activator SoxR